MASYIDMLKARGKKGEEATNDLIIILVVVRVLI